MVRERFRRGSFFNAAFLSIWGSVLNFSTVQIEKVRRDEQGLALAEKQITKHRSSTFIDACDLAIENATFNVFGNPRGEIRKAAKRVSFLEVSSPRPQLRLVLTLGTQRSSIRN